MAVITNDIYTREDAEYLMRAQVLPVGESHFCCGSAGTYSVLQADLAPHLASPAALASYIDEVAAALIGGFADVEITEVRPNSLRGRFIRGEDEMNLRIATAPREILARRRPQDGILGAGDFARRVEVLEG